MGELLPCRSRYEVLFQGSVHSALYIPLFQRQLDNFEQIHTISLSRNIIRALKSNPEVPALSQFPRLHQVRILGVLQVTVLMTEKSLHIGIIWDSLAF